MNTRDYKLFVAGQYYHIYNRGNAKNDVYKEDADFSLFLFRVKEQILAKPLQALGRYQRRLLPPGSFSLLAYCLMPNHFHLLIRQNLDTTVSELLRNVCSGYSKYFNRKYEQVGHVFQDQFKAIRVDNIKYLTWLSAYIHTNPVVAGLVPYAEGYTWSSYKDYLTLRAGTLCSKALVLDQFVSVEAYKAFVETSIGLTSKRKDLKNYLLD